MESIITVSGITKEFRPPLSLRSLLGFATKNIAIRALNNLSFRLSRGKILGILGPNGAGKTTLLKIIATLILPDQGDVIVNGYHTGKDDEKLKSFVGLVLDEERSFYWRLTGRQNLNFFAALHGLNKKSARKRIDELLDLFKADYADKRFDSYSTGMKRRFALMRGIIHNPGLILLDEPTKSLDYPTAVYLRNFIRDKLVKKEDKTVIFTSHHMDEAVEFADLFMILRKGTIIGLGTLNELRKFVNNPAASLGEIFLSLTQSYNA